MRHVIRQIVDHEAQHHGAEHRVTVQNRSTIQDLVLRGYVRSRENSTTFTITDLFRVDFILTYDKR